MTEAATAEPATGRLNRALALLVAGTFFMENLDGTIIATAAPAIAADLGVRPVDINVAMTAYLVTVAVCIPLSGWLADRFGGRRVFLVAIAVFTVASALCALSTSLPMLTAMPGAAGRRRRDDGPGRPAGRAARRPRSATCSTRSPT